MPHAAFVSAFILGLFYYWFALANRYIMFLYDHLGSTPFDTDTTSRYWMAGLVATGGVLVLYTLINWIVGRVAKLRQRTYSPPSWWHVWRLCALPLTAGILIITMCCNQPVLPLGIALCCVLATLAGLAIALMPGQLAAREPARLGRAGVWALGLLPALSLLHVIELPGRTSVRVSTAYAIAGGSVLAGTIWLVIGARWQARRKKCKIGARAVLVAGLGISYLLMPLIHHLVFAPSQYRYISSAANFFALGVWLQLPCLAVAALQAFGFAWLQNRWLKRAQASDHLAH